MNNNPLFKALQSSYRKGLRNTKYRWIIVLGTLAYLASPIDIAPDILPGIGWIDDGLIVTLLVSEVSHLMMENRKARQQDQGETATTYDTEEVIEVDAVAA